RSDALPRRVLLAVAAALALGLLAAPPQRAGAQVTAPPIPPRTPITPPPQQLPPPQQPALPQPGFRQPGLPQLGAAPGPQRPGLPRPAIARQTATLAISGSPYGVARIELPLSNPQRDAAMP